MYPTESATIRFSIRPDSFRLDEHPKWRKDCSSASGLQPGFRQSAPKTVVAKDASNWEDCAPPPIVKSGGPRNAALVA
jgi:hypothetical protein